MKRIHFPQLIEARSFLNKEKLDMKIIIKLSIALLTLQFGFTEIREINQMSEIKAEITQDTLVVFDIDNTLLSPKQRLGTDQWYESLLRDNIKNGMSEDAAIQHAIQLWINVQKKTDVRPIETSTPALVRELQAKGIRVMALTARPTDLAEVSLRQLKSLGIDFKKSSRLKDGVQIVGAQDTLTQGGVVFVGPKNNKGMILSQLLKTEKILASKIVFADDKSKHVNNVEKALSDSNVPYIGFRYAAADNEVKNFDTQAAKVELEKFLTEGIL